MYVLMFAAVIKLRYKYPNIKRAIKLGVFWNLDNCGAWLSRIYFNISYWVFPSSTNCCRKYISVCFIFDFEYCCSVYSSFDNLTFQKA